MYVSRAQLEETYRGLDSATICSKLLSRGLTAEAREVAEAELASRERDGELIDHTHSAPTGTPVAPARRAFKTAAKILFGLYVAFVLVCLLVLFFDPPWNTSGKGAYGGMVGLIASMAASFPWSIIFLRVSALAWPVYLVMEKYPLSILFFAWLGTPINFGLFWLYFKRAR